MLADTSLLENVCHFFLVYMIRVFQYILRGIRMLLLLLCLLHGLWFFSFIRHAFGFFSSLPSSLVCCSLLPPSLFNGWLVAIEHHKRNQPDSLRAAGMKRLLLLLTHTVVVVNSLVVVASDLLL